MTVTPKLSILADACLLKLYLRAQEGQEEIPYNKLQVVFESKIKSPVFKFAIEALIDQKNVNYNIQQTLFAINRVGYLKVEKELENKTSFFSIYSEKGDDWLFETGGAIEDGEADTGSKSATEAAWEPLPLDRQNPALAQAIEKIDELIQALEQDNGYAANEPDERSFILSALQAGAQALRDQTVIYRMQFRAFIWEPVKHVATRFGTSAIGVIEDTAKEIIKDWLKSAAKNWWS